jgi:hypothetical protein
MNGPETVDEIQVGKQQLIDTVKKWVDLDNKSRKVAQMMKQIREEKKRQNAQMIAIMREYEIDNVDLKDGQIQYKRQNRREALSQKRLLEILSEHPGLKEQQVNELNQYVYEKRRVTEIESIVRKVDEVDEMGMKVKAKTKAKGNKMTNT